MRTLLWFRGKDLRLHDHPALHAALAEGGELIPVFVLDPYFFEPKRARERPHRMAFLLDSLRELEARISQLGSRLILVEGRSVDRIPALARKWKVDQVLAMRWSEPVGIERDRRIADAMDIALHLMEGETLLPPGILRTQAGTPFTVFTAFAKAFHRQIEIGHPVSIPKGLPPLPIEESREPLPSLEALGITRNPTLMPGGETQGWERMQAFMSDACTRYHTDRDRMDLPGTSRLSADLHFGTLSIRTVWHEAAKAMTGEALAAFRNELLWREFAHSSLRDHPEMLCAGLKPLFRRMAWSEDESAWQAWVEGLTGYPAVDAAARQLLAEGFVHNRARMIAASFLVKDLLIDYRRGEAHYLKFLVDGDLAQNNAGWQWCAGCGFDAQPWFRIFNPVLQGRKFDPLGDYVRRWVPELRELPNRYIHAPWEAPPPVLEAADIRLGETYPRPVVDHAWARERFLGHMKAIKKANCPV